MARAWFPVLAVTIPAQVPPSRRERTLFTAPRALKEPVTCSLSSLKKTEGGMMGAAEEEGEEGEGEALELSPALPLVEEGDAEDSDADAGCAYAWISSASAGDSSNGVLRTKGATRDTARSTSSASTVANDTLGAAAIF